MNTYHENNYATYSLLLGIVYVYYKKDVVIDLEAAKEIVRDRLEFQDGRAYPVLCDITDVHYVAYEARTYLAFYGSQLTEHVALVCRQMGNYHMAEFFIGTDQPLQETQLFTNEAAALEFLETLKKKNNDLS